MHELAALQSAAIQDLRAAHRSALSTWQAVKQAITTTQGRRTERHRMLNGYIARARTVTGESAAIVTKEFDRLEREGEAVNKVLSALITAESEARGEVDRLAKEVAGRM